MNTDTRDRDDEEARADAPVMSAREVLGLEPRPLVVPDDQEMVLSPDNPQFARSFARVHLKTYADLQLLGLVPRHLSEDKVRKAISADDAEVYQMATRALSLATPCDCSGHAASDQAAARSNPLRSAYNRLRKHHHPALAAVMADHYGTHVAWDEPVSSIVRNWTSALRVGSLVHVALLGDITINKNATLTVASPAKSLLAWNIWIERTGRLVQQGSYLKIWANSMNRFRHFDLEAATAAAKISPVWQLNN
jgi:hypothetical protein